MLKQRWMWVVWPAFLVAGVLEVLVFAVVDPQDLQWAGTPLGWSRQGIYTAVFLVFWALTMLSSGLTALLAMSPAEVNRTSEPGQAAASTVATPSKD